MANDYRRQLKAQFCIVTDGAGRWLEAPAGPQGRNRHRRYERGIDRAVSGASGASHRGRPPAAVPRDFRARAVWRGNARHTHALVTRSTTESRRRLAELTRSEVNLTRRAAPSRAAACREAARGELRELIHERTASTSARRIPVVRSVGGVPYVAGTFPLSSDRAVRRRRPAGPAAGLAADTAVSGRSPPSAPSGRLRRLRPGRSPVAWRSAARMSRPLKDIAQAAGEVAAGNWARQVPTHGSAEATTMATAFNEMTSHLRHWHEQAEERAKRLETSCERFQSVTESARDGIVSTNAQGSITFWNRSAAAIFGYDEARALLERPLAHLLAEVGPAALPRGVGRRSRHAGRHLRPDGRTDRRAKERRPRSRSSCRVSTGTNRRHLRDGGAPRRHRTEAKRRRAPRREAQRRQAQKMEAIGTAAPAAWPTTSTTC